MRALIRLSPIVMSHWRKIIGVQGFKMVSMIIRLWWPIHVFLHESYFCWSKLFIIPYHSSIPSPFPLQQAENNYYHWLILFIFLSVYYIFSVSFFAYNFLLSFLQAENNLRNISDLNADSLRPEVGILNIFIRSTYEADHHEAYLDVYSPPKLFKMHLESNPLQVGCLYHESLDRSLPWKDSRGVPLWKW